MNHLLCQDNAHLAGIVVVLNKVATQQFKITVIWLLIIAFALHRIDPSRDLLPENAQVIGNLTLLDPILFTERFNAQTLNIVIACSHKYTT